MGYSCKEAESFVTSPASPRVFAHVLGRHLGFGNCGGLGRGNTSHPHLASAPIFYRSSIQDGGNKKPDLLSSVLLQNNACAAD